MTYGEWGCAGEWKHQDFRGFGEIVVIRTVEMAATAGNHGRIRERQGVDASAAYKDSPTLHPEGRKGWRSRADGETSKQGFSTTQVSDGTGSAQMPVAELGRS